jgi:hypothetical protein
MGVGWDSFLILQHKDNSRFEKDRAQVPGFKILQLWLGCFKPELFLKYFKMETSLPIRRAHGTESQPQSTGPAAQMLTGSPRRPLAPRSPEAPAFPGLPYGSDKKEMRILNKINKHTQKAHILPGLNN